MEAALKAAITAIFRLLALSVVATALALGAVELALRAAGIGAYSLSDRVLFYSLPAFVDDGLGSVRYAPSTTIREVAVFGDRIDYDTTYSSNNLGFLDSVDYTPTPAGVYDIIFLGDSFTAGTGGYPWVPELRDHFADPQSTRVYNLGIGSASIYHLDRLLDGFKKEVDFDEVNVLVISDDFYRPFWRPVQRDDALWFCPTAGEPVDCSTHRRPLVHRLSASDTPAQLLSRAQDIYGASRHPARSTPSILQQLHLYIIACDAYHRLRPAEANVTACPHLYYQFYREHKKNEKYRKALATLLAWPAKFPGVKFRLLHIPEKSETAIGRYTLDLGGDLKGVDIEFIPLLETCLWTLDMYNKHDMHFTRAGYRHLRDCVAKNVLTTRHGAPDH